MASFPQTQYFRHTRLRPDRQGILDEWIEQVILHPETEVLQADGRIRRWARISDFENRALNVVSITVEHASKRSELSEVSFIRMNSNKPLEATA